MPVSKLCGLDAPVPVVLIVNTVALDANRETLAVCSCLSTDPSPLLIIVVMLPISVVIASAVPEHSRPGVVSTNTSGVGVEPTGPTITVLGRVSAH